MHLIGLDSERPIFEEMEFIISPPVRIRETPVKVGDVKFYAGERLKLCEEAVTEGMPKSRERTELYSNCVKNVTAADKYFKNSTLHPKCDKNLSLSMKAALQS